MAGRGQRVAMDEEHRWLEMYKEQIIIYVDIHANSERFQSRQLQASNNYIQECSFNLNLALEVTKQLVYYESCAKNYKIIYNTACCIV